MKSKHDYFLAHDDIVKQNQEMISKFKQNDAILYQTLLKDIQKYMEVNVELQKIGKTFKGTTKRWALINYPDGIWSVPEPLLSAGNTGRAKPFEDLKHTGKDKTEWLRLAKIKFENREKSSKEWEVTDKNFRIVLNPTKSNVRGEMLTPIYLYFATPESREKVGKIMKLIKCRLLMQDQTTISIKKLLTVEESLYNYYSAVKLLSIKNEIIGRKAILNTKKNHIISQFQQFQFIGEKILSNFTEEHSKINEINSKRTPYKLGGSKSTIVGFRNQTIQKLSSMKELKAQVGKIVEALSIKPNRIQSNSDGNSVALKILKSDIKGNLVKLS
jgi:hypothetical protein